MPQCTHPHTSFTRAHRHTQTHNIHTHKQQTLSLTNCTFCACREMHWPACLRSGEEGGHALGVGALKRRPRVPAPPPALLQKQMCHECLFRYICKHVLIEAMRDLRAAVYGHICVHADANREPILFNKKCGHVNNAHRLCLQSRGKLKKSGCCIAVPYTWRCFLGPCTSLRVAAGGMHTDMIWGSDLGLGLGCVDLWGLEHRCYVSPSFSSSSSSPSFLFTPPYLSMSNPPLSLSLSLCPVCVCVCVCVCARARERKGGGGLCFTHITDTI
jgi:hypothetical protein